MTDAKIVPFQQYEREELLERHRINIKRFHTKDERWNDPEFQELYESASALTAWEEDLEKVSHFLQPRSNKTNVQRCLEQLRFTVGGAPLDPRVWKHLSNILIRDREALLAGCRTFEALFQDFLESGHRTRIREAGDIALLKYSLIRADSIEFRVFLRSFGIKAYGLASKYIHGGIDSDMAELLDGLGNPIRLCVHSC